MTLQNIGKQPDRLLRVSTPIARGAEMHTMAFEHGGKTEVKVVVQVPTARAGGLAGHNR